MRSTTRQYILNHATERVSDYLEATWCRFPETCPFHPNQTFKARCIYRAFPRFPRPAVAKILR